MNHIRKAAYYNSNGAIFLAVGDNRKAFNALKTSLQSLALAVVHFDQIPPQSPSESDNSGRVSRAVPRSPPPGVPNANLPSASEDGKPFLYSRGLVFYPSGNVSMAEISFYCSVVVFNLIVAFHRRKGNDVHDRDLNKLLSLYEMLLNLISDAARSTQYDCCNLIVATLNNKSVVHSELGQHTKARRMLYYVWDVMKYPDRRPKLLDTWEVEGIFLNIYLMLVNAPGVAGAA